MEYLSTIKNISVAICLDGSQKEYLDQASKENFTLNLDKVIKKGQYLIMYTAIPSFTNPNHINKKTIKLFKISNCKLSNN